MTSAHALHAPVAAPPAVTRTGAGWTLASAAAELEDSLLRLPLLRDSSIYFEWSGRRWLLSNALQPDSGDQVVTLRGHLGTLPFTAENRNARQQIVDTLRNTRHHARGQLRVDRRGRVFFNDGIAFPDPVSPQTLLTAATVMLLQTRPVVEAIAPLLATRKPDWFTLD